MGTEAGLVKQRYDGSTCCLHHSPCCNQQSVMQSLVLGTKVARQLQFDECLEQQKPAHLHCALKAHQPLFM
jgi:hypothetical protein